MGLTAEQLQGPRWSDAVICPRRCCYQAYNTEPSDDVPPYLEAIFWRSSVLGNAYQAKFVEENPGYVQEVDAPWGTDPSTGAHIGVGHIDLGNHDIAKAIEVKVMGGKIPQHAFLQVCGYVKFLGWEVAEIHVIDPANGKVTVTPVEVSKFIPDVEKILSTIEESLRMKTLPDRVCASPGAWQARGCAFRTKCFLGWIGDDMDLSVDIPEIQPDDMETLQALVSLGDELKSAKDHVARLEGIRDHLRAKLDLPVGQWVPFGDGFEVRLTPVKGQTTLNLSRAREAGWEVPPGMDQFVTQARGHTRWTIRQR